MNRTSGFGSILSVGFAALILVCPLRLLAQTVGELNERCSSAITNGHWPDVVDVCSEAVGAISDASVSEKGLTNADQLAMEELLTFDSAAIAHGYIELGDLRRAGVVLHSARIYLRLAQSYGLSQTSAKYRDLQQMIDGEAARLSSP